MLALQRQRYAIRRRRLYRGEHMTAAPTSRFFEPPAPAPRRPSATGPVILSGVRWQTYSALLDDMENARVRLTYDRGNLEIAALLFRHESYAGVLGELVKALA